MKEIIATGSTVEEAVENGLSRLGIKFENAGWEVIEVPKKSFVFKKPAKVRVYEKEEEIKIDVKSLLHSNTEPPRKEIKEVVKKETDEKESQKSKDKEIIKDKADIPQNIQTAKQKQTPRDNNENESEKIISPDRRSEKLAYAVNFVEEIAKHFDIENLSVTTKKDSFNCVIEVDGDNVGSLIGRKGETMEAISYLTHLACLKVGQEGERITVDISGYRKKREKNILNEVNRAVSRVRKTGRPYTFSPMSAYERRIVHAAAGKEEGITSQSKGVGSGRRVVIYLQGEEGENFDRARKDKKSYPRHKNQNSRDMRTDRSPRPAQSTREEKLEDVPGFDLYAKIEIDD
jgi:spoIIIJ-associated protein